jgi:hypothetical protein
MSDSTTVPGKQFPVLSESLLLNGKNLAWCLFWTTTKVMVGLYCASSAVQAAGKNQAMS